MNTETLAELAKKFINGNATEEEMQSLHSWYDAWLDDEEVVVTENETTEDQIGVRIFEALQTRIQHYKESVPVLPIWKRNWVKYAAAVFFAAGLVSLWFLNKPAEPKVLASQQERFKNDVKPGGNKAMLTLADGKKIILDSNDMGELAIQGNEHIEKTAAGELAYKSDHQKTAVTEVLYNMVTTPKGGQYQVLLPDGTRVWLNASSSLKFPTAFPGNEREVELKGEAYFEVAKNPEKPFHVTVNDMQVEVLGTHFNIMAYDNEEVIKTTLLEGSVKVSRAESVLDLIPGQQAQFYQNGPVKLQKDADIMETMAWKNGIFRFNDLTIKDIMRQVERWYDVTIQYEGNIPDHFVSTIPRNATMVQLFTILEETGKVHFTIDGKNITVMP